MLLIAIAKFTSKSNDSGHFWADPGKIFFFASKNLIVATHPEFAKFIFKDSNRILSDPVFLNKKVVIANADVFYNNSKKSKQLEKKFNL